MKRIFVAVLPVLFAVSACDDSTEMMSTPAAAPQGTVVTPLIGKTMTAGSAIFIFNSDGTVGGSLRGDPIVGVYDVNGQVVCSTYTSPDALVGREFCSTPDINGDKVIFNRVDGTQSPEYTISG